MCAVWSVRAGLCELAPSQHVSEWEKDDTRPQDCTLHSAYRLGRVPRGETREKELEAKGKAKTSAARERAVSHDNRDHQSHCPSTVNVGFAVGPISSNIQITSTLHGRHRERGPCAPLTGLHASARCSGWLARAL